MLTIEEKARWFDYIARKVAYIELKMNNSCIENIQHIYSVEYFIEKLQQIKEYDDQNLNIF